MASAGRCSELQALRFGQDYMQFKPKWAGVTLYFSPEFMHKNQKPNQSLFVLLYHYMPTVNKIAIHNKLNKNFKNTFQLKIFFK